MRHFRLAHHEDEPANSGAILAALVVAFLVGVAGVYAFDAGLVKMQMVSNADLPAARARDISTVAP